MLQFIVVLLVVPLAASNYTCQKPHQVFMTCGTACPESCSNMYKLRFCTMQCVEECQCERGYVVDRLGNCILQKDCTFKDLKCPKRARPMKCGDNRIQSCYDENTPSTSCRPTCSCTGKLVYDGRTDSCISRKFCYNSPENEECRKKDPNSEYQCTKKCGCVCNRYSVFNATINLCQTDVGTD